MSVITVFTTCFDIQSYVARPRVTILLSRRTSGDCVSITESGFAVCFLVKYGRIFKLLLKLLRLTAFCGMASFSIAVDTECFSAFLFGGPSMRSKAGGLKFVIDTLRIVFTFEVDHDLPLNIDCYRCPI